jgi:hypothetical protein
MMLNHVVLVLDADSTAPAGDLLLLLLPAGLPRSPGD